LFLIQSYAHLFSVGKPRSDQFIAQAESFCGEIVSLTRVIRDVVQLPGRSAGGLSTQQLPVAANQCTLSVQFPANVLFRTVYRLAAPLQSGQK